MKEQSQQRDKTTVYTNEYIVSTPGIVGGKPRFAGRRLPIHHIVWALLQENEDIADVMDAFDLSASQIYSALAYYYDHKPEIDKIMADEFRLSTHPKDNIQFVLYERWSEQLRPNLPKIAIPSSVDEHLNKALLTAARIFLSRTRPEVAARKSTDKRINEALLKTAEILYERGEPAMDEFFAAMQEITDPEKPSE